MLTQKDIENINKKEDLRKKDFILEYEKLCLKYNVFIDGLSCCKDNIWLTAYDDTHYPLNHVGCFVEMIEKFKKD